MDPGALRVGAVLLWPHNSHGGVQVVQVNYTLPIPDHWDVDTVPWHAILGERAHMEGGTGVVTGVEVDVDSRTFVLSVAPVKV
jgi:hypothetical protein